MERIEITLGPAEVAQVGAKAKHTPGPWRVGQVGNDRIYASDGLGDQSGPVAEALHRCDPLERVANRALIAAAPDLLLKLKAAREVMSCYLRSSHPLLQDIDEAIAKAEGR